MKFGWLKFLPTGWLSYAKWIAIISLLSSIVGYHLVQVSNSYTDGVTDTELKYERLQNDENKKELDKVLIKLKESLEFKEGEAKVAANTISELDRITKELSEYKRIEYEDVIKNLDCNRFGDDYFRLFNEPVIKAFPE